LAPWIAIHGLGHCSTGGHGGVREQISVLIALADQLVLLCQFGAKHLKFDTSKQFSR